MAGTYKLIGSVTVGAGGAADITFTSIPSTYTDLCLLYSTRSSATATQCGEFLRLNSDTGSNYKYLFLRGSGSAVASGSGTLSSTYVGQIPAANVTASTFGNTTIYFPNYTTSNQKSISVDAVGENNATEAYALLTADLWTGTSAISTIKIYPDAGSYVQYSTAYLYGIEIPAQQITPKATGGDITYDASYVYHTFRQSGTFTPTQSLTADYLVVAGGGGGGNNYAGGGGGGGLIYITAGSLTAQNYTVTVGAGGAVNASGSNTVFNSQTAVGGGRGGDNNNAQPGGNGGSGGGGASSNTAGYRVGGTATASQGYDGGTGTTLGTFGSGGGGGAGGIGGNGSGGTGGTGGAGLQYFGTYYATGGQGNGSTPGSAPTGGTAAYTTPITNTGKGGPFEIAGASGIVIVRYAI